MVYTKLLDVAYFGMLYNFCGIRILSSKIDNENIHFFHLKDCFDQILFELP